MQDLMEIVKGRSILRVPPEYEQVVLIPLVYPAKISKAPKHREVEEFLHTDMF